MAQGQQNVDVFSLLSESFPEYMDDLVLNCQRFDGSADIESFYRWIHVATLVVLRHQLPESVKFSIVLCTCKVNVCSWIFHWMRESCEQALSFDRFVRAARSQFIPNYMDQANALYNKLKQKDNEQVALHNLVFISIWEMLYEDTRSSAYSSFMLRHYIRSLKPELQQVVVASVSDGASWMEVMAAAEKMESIFKALPK